MVLSLTELLKLSKIFSNRTIRISKLKGFFTKSPIVVDLRASFSNSCTPVKKVQVSDLFLSYYIELSKILDH